MGHVFISPCELRLKTACLGVPKKFACCAAVLGGTGAHAAFVFAVASKSSFWVLFGRIYCLYILYLNLICQYYSIFIKY